LSFCASFSAVYFLHVTVFFFPDFYVLRPACGFCSPPCEHRTFPPLSRAPPRVPRVDHRGPCWFWGWPPPSKKVLFETFPVYPLEPLCVVALRLRDEEFWTLKRIAFRTVCFRNGFSCRSAWPGRRPPPRWRRRSNTRVFIGVASVPFLPPFRFFRVRLSRPFLNLHDPVPCCIPFSVLFHFFSSLLAYTEMLFSFDGSSEGSPLPCYAFLLPSLLPFPRGSTLFFSCFGGFSSFLREMLRVFTRSLFVLFPLQLVMRSWVFDADSCSKHLCFCLNFIEQFLSLMIYFCFVESYLPSYTALMLYQRFLRRFFLFEPDDRSEPPS